MKRRSPPATATRPAVVPSANPHRRVAALALILAALTLLIYLPVGGFDFVNYDDPDYVTNNPHVRAGVNAGGLAWALTSQAAGNWHPLTWVSHMLDVQLFGMNAGGHHLTNVALHVLNVLLLFWLLTRMTGAVWRSACVAILFALHPLHVESVAWIAERKDVLSGTFWLLTMLAYLRFVAQPTRIRYALVLLLFCLGLMAKAMLVTLPFVLLLIDVWPLKRWPRLAEKVPLFVVSIAASVVTFVAQRHAGAVTQLDVIPLASRAGNAVISYCWYLADTFWPSGLAAFYAMPDALPLWEVLSAAALLIAISILAWRRRSYWFTGWFWYVGTLVPVIGLVQVGSQARADRYTYLPLIGIFVIVAWGLNEIVVRRPGLRPVVVTIAVTAVAGCSVMASQQISYWRDTSTLFEHAVAADRNNYVALDGLGNLLRTEGHPHEAIARYEALLRVRPGYEPGYVHLASALLADNRTDDSIAAAKQAIALNGADPEAYVNLAAAQMRRGRFLEAEGNYRRAVTLHPDDAVARCGLGLALAEEGKHEEGLGQLRQTVALNPAYADAHYNLGRILGLLGRNEEAIAEFTTTVKLVPNDVSAHFSLGTALGNAERFEQAIGEFNAALQLKPDYVNAHLNLGRVLAAAGGRDSEAAAQFREVLRLEPGSVEAREGLQAVGGNPSLSPHG